MMIRTAFAAVLVALASMSAAPARAADDEVVVAVKDAAAALDMAFEKRDAAAIKGLMTADHVSVTPYYAAVFDVDQQIATLDTLTYSITAEDPAEITVVDDDTAIITQTKTCSGTFEGRTLPSRVYASALWVEQDGHWLEKRYQETAIAAK